MDRRTILRGAGGIALSLPWLEAMGAGILDKNVRMAFTYMANGVDPDHWSPKGSGKLGELSKTLAPLDKVKEHICVHKNLHHPNSVGADGHFPKCASYLSGAKVKKTTSDPYCGQSIDQLAAQLVGKDSYLPSIELGAHPTRAKAGNAGYTLIYAGHISWINPKTPAPKEVIPAQAFKRLFKGAKKNSSTPAETKSVLDYIKDDAARIKRTVGREDLYRLNQYFHSVRALERRIQKASSDNFKMPRDAKTPPSGIPSDYTEHCNMMLDIIILAFQTNRTKIATFMFENELSNQKYPFLNGVKDSHHSLSHHQGNKDMKAGIEKITRYYITLYARMIEKMSQVKEGNGSLLDNSLILFGAGLKDGNRHSPIDLPIIVAGKGGGKAKTGIHKVHRERTKFNNLLLGMAQATGCKINKFGDSDGSIV